MKQKITVFVVAVLAGGLGYWAGSYRVSVRVRQWWERWEPHSVIDQETRWRRNGEHQAFICLGALTNLHAGKGSEAEAILENYLSEGIARHVSSTWTNDPRYQSSYQNIALIRAVRNYRQQHPWTNDEPERVESLQKAFKLAE